MRKPPALRAGRSASAWSRRAPRWKRPPCAPGVRVLERRRLSGARRRRRCSSRPATWPGATRSALADLLDMFADPDVRAIVAARGGYGSGRLLPLFDPAIARAATPRSSSATAISPSCSPSSSQRAELVAFHGPMVVGLDRNPDGAAALLGLLSGDRAGWNLVGDARSSSRAPPKGVIVGGCLSILVAALGTPYDIDTAGRLLFLEDVNEKPYRIDRMLTQLRQAGKLDGVAGVIVGEMAGCVSGPSEAVTVRDVIARCLRRGALSGRLRTAPPATAAARRRCRSVSAPGWPASGCRCSSRRWRSEAAMSFERVEKEMAGRGRARRLSRRRAAGARGRARLLPARLRLRVSRAAARADAGGHDLRSLLAHQAARHRRRRHAAGARRQDAPGRPRDALLPQLRRVRKDARHHAPPAQSLLRPAGLAAVLQGRSCRSSARARRSTSSAATRPRSASTSRSAASARRRRPAARRSTAISASCCSAR